ncbi:hypothetical protein DFH08DRAFT_958176 [Mycena albidolilacea]|uniref:Uncharacterized protein n=1 Tax=Mycena albidolilacea TaxID=1033008 RepID=A0AAD7A6H6_9AGAR|nr:hypothetical protein DFH08DRAFT_958176 [Mycena albidolilacea]
MLNGALGALIQLRRKYNSTNILAAAGVCITRINPMMLDAYDNVLLLVNVVYKPTQIVPHCRLSSDLAVLAHQNGITVTLPAAYYRTLVFGNNNSPVQPLDGLTRQDGAHTSLPPLGLRCCLIGREHLLVKQFQPEYMLGWLRVRLQSPTCGDAAGCTSPYSAASWTTASLWAAQARQGVPDALRHMHQRGRGGDGDQAQEGVGGFAGIL